MRRERRFSLQRSPLMGKAVPWTTAVLLSDPEPFCSTPISAHSAALPLARDAVLASGSPLLRCRCLQPASIIHLTKRSCTFTADTSLHLEFIHHGLLVRFNSPLPSSTLSLTLPPSASLPFHHSGSSALATL